MCLGVDYVCQDTRGSLHPRPNKPHNKNERAQQESNTTSSLTAFTFSLAYTFAAHTRYQMSSSLASTLILANSPQPSPPPYVTQYSAPPPIMSIPTEASPSVEVVIDRVDEFIQVFFTLVSLSFLPSNHHLVKVSSSLNFFAGPLHEQGDFL
jgi:hypothetical protein